MHLRKQLNRTEPNRIYCLYGITMETRSGILEGHAIQAATADESTVSLEVRRTRSRTISGKWKHLIGYSHNGPGPRMFRRKLESVCGGWIRYEFWHSLALEYSRDGRSIRLLAGREYPRDSLGAFLVSTAMVYYFRVVGRQCIHGAVVGEGDDAAVICGPSGAGKSTIAAAMSRKGWSVLSDDIAVVDDFDEWFRVRSGYGRVRLWPGTSGGLGISAEVQQIVSGVDKAYFTTDAASDGRSKKLSALVLLGRRGPAGSQLRVETLDRNPQTVKEVYSNLMGIRGASASESLAALSACRRIVGRVPCYRIALASDFSGFDDLSDWLRGAIGGVRPGALD